MTNVVAAVIERDGRILIAQRQKDAAYHPLQWEFPGGKVEPGEEPPAALLRELREELAIEARIGGELARYGHQYPGRAPVLLIFYEVTSFIGEPQNLAFEQILWALPQELREYDFLEGDDPLIQRYLTAGFKRPPTSSSA